jgi:hypothetical protein
VESRADLEAATRRKKSQPLPGLEPWSSRHYTELHTAHVELQSACMPSYKRGSCRNITSINKRYTFIIRKAEFDLMFDFIAFNKYFNLKYRRYYIQKLYLKKTGIVIASQNFCLQ